ncbi:hypothetical protein [Stenotrophomonas sp. SORGH_AS_0282]|nr:hypothetical protein [Stenotrophomonas sp. SORGH_AS_0282]
MLAIVEEIFPSRFSPPPWSRRIQDFSGGSLVNNDRFRTLAKDALVWNVDFRAEARALRLQQLLEIGVRNVQSRSTQCRRIATGSLPASRGMPVFLDGKIDVSGQHRHLTGMIGFLKAICFLAIAAVPQLLDQLILFLDGTRTRLDIRTTHGKLYCSVKDAALVR